jgi:FeS assembly SUF system protein
MSDKPQPGRLNLAKLAQAAPETPAVPVADREVDLSPEGLKEKIIAVLRTCYDPELPVSIYELGLVYNIDLNAAGAATIRMTLTSPGCPVAGSLASEVQSRIKALPGVTSAQVDVVWDPPWDKSRMSEAARLELGIYDM